MIVTPEGIIIGGHKKMLLNWKWLSFAADSVFHLQGAWASYEMTHDNHAISLKWDSSDKKNAFKGFEKRMLNITIADKVKNVVNEFLIDLAHIKE